MNGEDVYETISVLVDGSTGVATVCLNRPDKRNALSPLLVDELSDAVAWADADERVGAIMLRGEGKDFCAGVDLQSLSDLMDEGVGTQLADADALGDLFLIFRRIETPIIAAVHGNAIAGGCGLATACDIVLASDDAKFGYPEVKIGFVPAMVIAMLLRAVGEKRTFDLVTTGRIVDARTAESYGLVQHVFQAAEFEIRAQEFVEEMAQRSTSAVALCKRLIYQTERHSFEAAIRAGAEINALARMTDDYREGVSGFVASKGKKGKS